MLGIPKTTLMFGDSLEGLIGLRIAVMVMVYYSEKTQIKNQERENVYGTKFRRNEVQASG